MDLTHLGVIRKKEAIIKDYLRKKKIATLEKT